MCAYVSIQREKLHVCSCPRGCNVFQEGGKRYDVYLSPPPPKKKKFSPPIFEHFPIVRFGRDFLHRFIMCTYTREKQQLYEGLPCLSEGEYDGAMMVRGVSVGVHNWTRERLESLGRFCLLQSG